MTTTTDTSTSTTTSTTTGDDVISRIDAATAGHDAGTTTGTDAGTDTGTAAKADGDHGDGPKLQIVSLCGHDHGDDSDPTGLRAALMLRTPGHTFWKRKQVDLPAPIAAIFGPNAAIPSNTWIAHWSTPAGMHSIGFTATDGTADKNDERYTVIVETPVGGKWKMKDVDTDAVVAKLDALDVFTMPTAAEPPPGKMPAGRTLLAPHVPANAYWSKVEPDGNTIADLIMRHTSDLPEVWSVQWTTPDGECAVGISPTDDDGSDLYNVLVVAKPGSWTFDGLSGPAVIRNLTMLGLLGAPAGRTPEPAGGGSETGA